MSTLPKISPQIFKAYQEEIAKNGSPSTAKRKAASLNKFFDWAQTKGHIDTNPIDLFQNKNNFIVTTPTSKKANISHRVWITSGVTLGIVIVIFLLVYKLQFPIEFIKSFAQESELQTESNNNSSSNLDTISANSAANGSWNLYAKLKLMDLTGSPKVGSQTLSFKLYNTSNNGTALYSSDNQTITTDSNGSVLISLDKVPSDLFFQNNTLYIEPQIDGQGPTLSSGPRIPVSTANTPSNLGGFFPANPETGAGALAIPVIDSNGTLALASESPAIKAKQGNLLIEGQTVTIKTTDGGGGNLEFNPDANGYAHFLFEGSKGNFLNAQGPNLTSGSLYYGMVPNNATGYDLIRLQSGSPKMTTKFSVDALGNTKIAGDLYTGGTDRLTSSGVLENITGYTQSSGNFTIQQGAGNFASINKTITSGGALSDVLTLTLDERGKPATSNSDYSTLVLNRYDGSNAGAALKVNTGNAIFNGQLELGRYSTLPGAIGQGSLVFNTTDNQVYFWDGTAWVAMGSGGFPAFNTITSGTNTTATMIVGSGASLTFSGTGTITASELTCVGCVANSELANSSITFAGNSGSTAISLGATENIVGGTTITTTQSGSTLTVDVATNSLDFAQFQDLLDLDASTDINLGAFTLSTSGTGALNFASTGQVSFAGNVDATNGLDVTGSITQNTFGVCDSSGANCPAGASYWTQSQGTLYPTNNTVNVLIGSNATTSADFAFTGVDGGLPTASIAGNIASVATFLTGNGNLGTTNMQDLTLGGSTTGNVIINSRGSDALTANGANVTIAGDLAVNGGDITTNQTTFNLINSTATTLNIGGDATTVTIGDATGTTTINNALAVTLATNLNGDTTIGNAITDNITFTGRVAQDSDLIPITTTGTNDLGTALLPWDNIYGVALFQNGNAVCDSSGSGCPFSGGYWSQTLGALYPTNNSVDVLIGSNATTSADFAFTGVDGGLPTASIAGNIAGVATYLTGNGNLATTNFQNITLGGLTTGNITLSPSNDIAGGNVSPNVTNVTDLGTASLLFRNIYGTTIYQGANQVCDVSGNCSGGTGGSKWKLSLGAISPFSDSLDVLIGSSATASAKFAFTNILTGTPTLNVSAQATNIAIIDATANALQILEGANAYLAITTSDGTENMSFGNITTNPSFSFLGSGATTLGGDLAVNGATSADINSTTTTATVFNSTVTTLSMGGAATTINIGLTGSGASSILLAGGSTDTGCTLDGSNGNMTCSGNFLTTATSGTQGWWQRNDGVLSPANITDDLAIGGIATASAKFQVASATGNIISSGDLALNGGDLTSTATTFNFDIGNTGTLNFRDGTNTLVAITDQGTTGRLAVSDSLQVGGLTTVAYSRFGTTATDHGLSALQDVLIDGSLELNGTFYLDGGNIAAANGTATISFGVDPTINTNILSNGSWRVTNSTNVGLAALIVNQTKGGDIFSASGSGTTRFNIANNGVVTITTTATPSASLIVDGGIGKIDVGTIDPPYTINGKKFATFMAGMVGIKEETTGIATTNEYVPGIGYRSVIDFNNQPEGSDLWLFGKTTNIKENMDKLVALLTPSSSTRVWYDLDRTNKRLVIYSARPTQISYRLTGPRFDYQRFPNQRDPNDPTPGFILNNQDTFNNNPIVAEAQQIASFVIEKVQDGFYTLRDSTGTIVDGVESVGNLVAGNIRAGIVNSQLLIADKVAVNLISPIPSGTDVTVRLGNDATPYGKLAIQDNSGNEVASIDTTGNARLQGDLTARQATFSGELYAKNIHSDNLDEIKAMLTKVKADQDLLTQIQESTNLNATNSANLDQIAVSNLFVTDQAAINSLSIAKIATIGTDLVFQSTINDQQSAINTIDTLTAPLKLQSLALAPVEIMSGLVKIDTRGNVEISGNLNVIGKITTPQLDAGIINATGSAIFASVSTSGLIIGAADATVAGVVANGEVSTNSTIGKAIIPAGTSEITIKNQKITDYSLIYVTPTSSTENNVLYIKSKQAGQFVVGFTNPIGLDVSFNWWIVQIQ